MRGPPGAAAVLHAGPRPVGPTLHAGAATRPLLPSGGSLPLEVAAQFRSGMLISPHACRRNGRALWQVRRHAAALPLIALSAAEFPGLALRLCFEGPFFLGRTASQRS